MGAFITGSHAYGTPRQNSDIDMVVLLPWDDYKILCRTNWDETYEYGNGTSDPLSLRIKLRGLDLIVTGHVGFYEAWLWANRLLKKEKPVTRERAVEVIKGCLDLASVTFAPTELKMDNNSEDAAALLAEALR